MLINHGVGVLEEIGYLDGRSTLVVANTLTRIAARAHLNDEEVNNLLGMVKHLKWWTATRSEQ